MPFTCVLFKISLFFFKEVACFAELDHVCGYIFRIEKNILTFSHPLYYFSVYFLYKMKDIDGSDRYFTTISSIWQQYKGG